MEKVLSIVIPTYNMEKYLRKCLGSLIVSTAFLDKLEVLVINDGSKDDSLAIAQEYQSKYPNTFVVIDKENGNYGSCVNRGLKEATGKYIKVLDADDSFDTNNFEEFLDYLLNKDVDLVISDYCVVDMDDKVTETFSYELPDAVFRMSDLPKGIERSMAMHAVTYKTENLREINYKQTEGISYTDMEWIFTPMTTVNKALYFNKVVYLYLVGREGQTIDYKVRLKSLNMEAIILKKMTISYNELYQNNLISSSKQDAKQYMDAFLIRRLVRFYNAYLLTYSKFLQDDELIDFDSFLYNNSQQFYNVLDDLKIKQFGVNYRYIHEWRKKSALFKLYAFFKMIKWKIIK